VLEDPAGGSTPCIASSAFRNASPPAARLPIRAPHIYYLPELYCAYFGPLLLSLHRVAAGGPAGDRPRRRVRIHPRPGARLRAGRVDHGRDETRSYAALALIALGHLGADVKTFTPALHCIVSSLGGRRQAWTIQRL